MRDDRYDLIETLALIAEASVAQAEIDALIAGDADAR